MATKVLSRQTRLLSLQKYACRDNFCHDKQLFVATKIFCCDKHNFVATKVLSWQAYFCRNKRVFCRDKHRLRKRLSRQKLYLWRLPPMIELGRWDWRRNRCKSHREGNALQRPFLGAKIKAWRRPLCGCLLHAVRVEEGSELPTTQD